MGKLEKVSDEDNLMSLTQRFPGKIMHTMSITSGESELQAESKVLAKGPQAFFFKPECKVEKKVSQ